LLEGIDGKEEYGGYQIPCQYLTSITQNALSRRIPYLVVMPAAKKLEISYQINYISHYVNALRYIETIAQKWVF